MLLEVLTPSIIPFWKALMTPDSYLNSILKKKEKKRKKKKRKKKEKKEKRREKKDQVESTQVN